jgi:hypothetical protein
MALRTRTSPSPARPPLLVFRPSDSYARRAAGFPRRLLATAANTKMPGDGGNAMRRTLLILGLIGLAIGLLWIGQGTGAVAWPRSSFMINQIQWAGYGAVLSAVGLILIWQSQRP